MNAPQQVTHSNFFEGQAERPTAGVFNMPVARLQDKAGICAYLGGISPNTYDKWQAKGIVPGPVRGTNRYDLRAHDSAIDRISGLVSASINMSSKTSRIDPLDEFLSSYAS